MPGYDINRFTDLNESLTNNLICSICLDVFNNAVRSDCEHNFCKDCIQDWVETNNIEDNHKKCPKCREEFPTRKRSNDNRNDNNLVIIRNFIFKRSVWLNTTISDLKIKCDFNFNGCQQSVKLSQLSAHISECQHKYCGNCGFTLTNIEDHNCFELLKNNINDWKEVYENQFEINRRLKEENFEFKTKLETNEKTINELKQKYDKSLEKVIQLKNLNKTNQTINDWKVKYEKQLEINNKLKEENTINNTKLQTNNKTINELKQNWDKSLKFIDELKLMNTKLKEENQTKPQTNEKTINELNQKYGKSLEEISKLNTELQSKETENKEKFKTIIQNTLEKRPFFSNSSQTLTNDLKEDIRHYLSGLLLLIENFFPSIFCIQFGNYTDFCASVSIKDNIIKFASNRNNNNVHQKVDFNLSLNQLQEVIYSDTNFRYIHLKTSKQMCDTIAQSLGLSLTAPNGHRFDVNSKDPKHWYIVLRFNPIIVKFHINCFLRYLKLSEPNIKFIKV